MTLTLERPCRHQFIIIGAMKAGTTSLFRFLTSHPEIAGSATKEQVQLMVTKLLRLKSAPKPADAADGVAAALAFLLGSHTERLLKAQ